MTLARFAVAFVIACGAPPRSSPTLSASPGQIASDVPPTSCKPARSGELMPATTDAGSVRIYPAPHGFDIFWTAGRRTNQAYAFDLGHAKVSADGKLQTTPGPLLETNKRHMAPGPNNTYGVTYQTSTPKGWHGHAMAIEPTTKKVLWDVEIPSQESGHSTVAIAFDPVARHWVLVGEELVALPPGSPRGSHYSRLFTARLDEQGTFKLPPTYLTAPDISGKLSDWGNPLIWANDRLAVVSSESGNNLNHVFVTEITFERTTRLLVTTVANLQRGVLAWTKSGYVIAAGESGPDLTSRVYLVTLRNGVASPPRYLSDPRLHGAEPVIASDGTRVAIGWNESDIRPAGPRGGVENRGAFAKAVVIDAAGNLTPVSRSEPPEGRHDWAESMTWDGCRFAFVHTHGINPSSHQIVQF